MVKAMTKTTTTTTTTSTKEAYTDQNIQIKGSAAFPKLDRPYKYDKVQKKSLPDPEGEFSVAVVVNAKEADAYIKKIDDIARAAGVNPAKAKNMPYAPETDKEGEETGNIKFNCKGYGTRRDGTPNRIQHWTAAGKPAAKDFRLGAGSIIRVDLWAKPFKELGGGVRLNLNAVQILKAAEYMARNPFARDEEYANDEVDGDEVDGMGVEQVADESEDESEDTDF